MWGLGLVGAVSGGREKGQERLMLRDSVYELLKARLMNHECEPGSRMSIDGLARELHVSPTPVREALTRLISDGLVLKRPHAGYRAAPLLGSDQLGHVFAMRLLLEPHAARCAAQSANPQELEAIAAIASATRAPAVGEDYAAYRDFVMADARLHRAVASAAGNPLVVDALDRLGAHTHHFRLYYRTGMAEAAMEEHEALVDALQSGDAPRAERAMRDHLNRSQARLLSAFGDR